MTIGDLDEAVAILATMLTAILGTLSGAVGRDGASLRYAVGDLQATAPTLLRTASLGAPLLNCFDLAFQAGATLVEMETVRAAMTAVSPIGLAGIAVANAGIRMALVEESKILAATTFTSSQDVFAAVWQMNSAFESAEEFAADNRDPANYQALISLHAAVTQDLTTRAMSLPQLITYSMARIMTSHALANRLYGDASRCDELRAENKVIHPAFMPLSGTALSE